MSFYYTENRHKNVIYKTNFYIKASLIELHITSKSGSKLVANKSQQTGL